MQRFDFNIFYKLDLHCFQNKRISLVELLRTEHWTKINIMCYMFI